MAKQTRLPQEKNGPKGPQVKSELTLEEIKKLNIFEKMQLVAMEVMNVEKDMEIGKGNYKYRAVSDNSVTLAVKRAEAKYRIFSSVVKQELISSKTEKTLRSNGDEALIYVDNIKMTIRFVNLDNPSEEEFTESLGKGIDSADKGFGKASTYARKYGLLNAYKIATGEDPDADKSEQITAPANANEFLVAITDYYSKNENEHTGVLSYYGANKLSDLSEKNIKVVYNTLKQKGKL